MRRKLNIGIDLGTTYSSISIYNETTGQTESVKVNGNVVVKQGTEVTAQVARLKNNFILGIPGEMELTNFQLMTSDSDPIPLRGNVKDKGEGRYWAHVGWFFLFPLLFVKGGDGKIPATVQYTMYTMEEVNL